MFHFVGFLEERGVWVVCHQLPGVVRRARVHHEMLERHAFLGCHALEAIGDVAPVVETGGDYGDVNHWLIRNFSIPYSVALAA